MSDQIVQIEVDINEKVDVNIHISDILYAVNRLPLLKKWNTVGAIIRNLNLSKKDDDGEDIEKEDVLNSEQVQLVKSFLEKHLEIINNYKV